MPKIVKEEKDSLNAVLTVTLQTEDYLPKFKSELAKYKKSANMKGFRKGKTPISLLKKMYGKGVLVDVINDMMQKEVADFLKKEDIDILGQPLPSESQESLRFDLNDMGKYEFKFDLGIAPAFEVLGADENETFDMFDVKVDDKRIDEEMDYALKRLGKQIPVESTIQENDVIKINALEIDGDEVKNDGVEANFSVNLEQLANDDLRKDLLTKKSGDVFRFSLYDLEKDKDNNYYRKYYLGLDEKDVREVGERFEGYIESVMRLEPAVMDQEFFDNYFGKEVVKSETEARNKIRINLEEYYKKQSEGLLYKDFQERLLEKNEINLPDEFLKRWLKASDEKLDEEKLSEEYDGFRKNLQWTLIRSKLIKRYDIVVNENDIVDTIRQRVRNYFGGNMADSLIEPAVQRMLSNQEQVNEVYQELVSDRLFEAAMNVIKINKKSIELDAFLEEVKKAREQASA